MKKIFLLSVTLFIAMVNFAQMQTQQGISYRYNGKNPRTPLPNVTVECVTANNAVISDSTGSFTLNFNKLKMGDRIGFVTVKKREMMVFNQHAVDEWSIRKEPLCLILCDANEFEQQKQNLIDIGRREAQKKYDRQKAELQKQLDASEIDRAKYEVELDKAYEELDRLHKHLDEYADLFARIDESEIDSTAQQAMDLFNQGQVDEAVRLFEHGDYLEKLKKARVIKKQAQEAIAQIEQAEAAAEQDSIEAIQSLKAQIAAYKVQNEWEKARVLLKGLADELNTYEFLYDYAIFCKGQNLIDDAEAYLHKTLDVLKSLEEAKPQAYLLLQAKATNSLAYLYSDTQKDTWATIWFNVTLLTCEKYSETEGYSAKSDMIMLSAINGLADLYLRTKQYDKSEELLYRVLPILTRLNEIAEKDYDINILLSTVAKIGDFCVATKDYENAESMYNTCLQVCEMIANDFLLAGAKENLAHLYSVTGQTSKSEALFKDAINILQRYAIENPQANQRFYAEAIYNLACLYEQQQRSDGEKLFEDVYPIFELISQDHPIYLIPLANTCLSLGFFYFNEQRFEEAITKTQRALSVYKQVGIEKWDLQYDYLRTLMLLSLIYSNTSDYLNCYQNNLELIPLLNEFFKKEPQFRSQYATTLGNQSYYAIFLRRFNESEKLSREALQIDTTSTIFETNLAASLLFQGKYSEAEAIYRQYKDELKDSFLQDMQDFEAAGIIPEERKADVEKIRELLSE